MVVVVYLLDRTLLRDESKSKLIFRMVISLVIALFISIPLKVSMGEEALKSHIIQEASRHNQELRNQVHEVRRELQAKKDRIDADIMRYSEKDMNGQITQVQKLVEARRLKQELLDTWEDRIAEAEVMVADQMINDPDTSFVAQMTTFLDLTINPSKSSNPIAAFLNGIIFCLFALTEAMPSILRSTLQSSFYIRAIRHKNGLIHVIQDRLEEVQNLLVTKDSLEGNQILLKKQSYFIELARQASFALKSTEELERLHQECLEAIASYEREQEQRYQQQFPTQQPKENGQVAEDEAPEFIYD